MGSSQEHFHRHVGTRSCHAAQTWITDPEIPTSTPAMPILLLTFHAVSNELVQEARAVSKCTGTNLSAAWKTSLRKDILFRPSENRNASSVVRDDSVPDYWDRCIASSIVLTIC